MGSSARESLLALRARALAAKERTAQAQQQVEERRATRGRKRAEVEARAEVPSFDVPLTNDGQERVRPVNSTNVREWLRAGLRTLYGDKLTLPQDSEWWTVGEKKLAKRLLTQYGPELVAKAVAHFCATWPQRVEAAAGRLGGIPTIGLLWKLRDGLFAEAQGIVAPQRARRKRKDKNSDEYQRPKKPIGVGWT